MPTETLLLRRRRAYATSPDRIGLALGAGLLMAAALAGLLGSAVPDATLPAVMVAAGGGVLWASLVFMIAAPLWLACHNRRWRSPGHAALAAFFGGFLLLLIAQIHAFGLAMVPAQNAASTTQGLRWTSAVATSLFWALPSGAIGAVMWRIAYRRVWP